MKEKTQPLEILKELKNLEEDDIPTNVDEIILDNCKKVSRKDYKEMIEILYDVVVLMRDPRNLVPFLNTIINKKNASALLVNPLYVYKLIYFLMKNCDYSFDSFYINLYNNINIKNLEEDYEVFLFFIVTIFEDKEIPMKVGKAFVKLLLQLSLSTRSRTALSILYSVLLIMRLHPSLYVMALPSEYKENLMISHKENVRITSFEMLEVENYLFELSIHEESIECISNICKIIKKEASCRNARPKFVNLKSIRYPLLKF